ncbi:hypothetical protein F4677DRAFT_413747 [Hypoxylon crocopeplum]|nr:hypothetical protein F4677DRAFT_413747 [Hypoxylon crocopeplum]
MSITRPRGTTTTVDEPLSDSLGQLVPLLTTFTPPASCINDWVYDTETEGTVWKDRSYNTLYPIDCQPFNGHNTVYRPGICPSGQEFSQLDVIVETDGGTASSRVSSWYMGYCCSTGYRLSFRERFSEYPNCFSGLVPPVVATVRGAIATDTDTTSTTTLGSALVAIEEPVSIVWVESDLTWFPDPVANSFRALMGLPPLTTTTSSTHSATGLGPSMMSTTMPTATSASSGPFPLTTSTTSPQDINQQITDVSTERSVLSGGAIAGICVGVVAFLALLGTICYLTCIRRRKKKADQQGPVDDGGPKEQNENWMPELQDTQMGSRSNPFYISQRHTELPGTTVAAHSYAPVELESPPIDGSGPAPWSQIEPLVRENNDR